MIVTIGILYILFVLVVFGLQLVIRPMTDEHFDPTDLDDVIFAAGASFMWPIILVVLLAVLPFALVWLIARNVAKEE